jgi:hypothetical protein
LSDVRAVQEARDHDELVQRCNEYLGGLGVSMWGRAFDVNSTRGRGDAAAWLAKQIEMLEGRVL